jgi:nitrite reductase/ring-hydroxylating ferredoxin subunit
MNINMRKARHWSMQLNFGIVLCLLAFFASCNQDLSDDPIPEAFFADLILNLNLPEYNSLRNDGGIFSIPDKGVRGIFVYRKSATSYIAYERNCSFQPADACATVDVHSSNLFMIDSCCNSSFDWEDGTRTGGPAWRPLRRYRTFLTGTELTIVAESVNGI